MITKLSQLAALSVGAIMISSTASAWEPNPVGQRMVPGSYWQITQHDGVPIPAGDHGIKVSDMHRTKMFDGCNIIDMTWGAGRYAGDRFRPNDDPMWVPRECERSEAADAYAAILDTPLQLSVDGDQVVFGTGTAEVRLRKVETVDLSPIRGRSLRASEDPDLHLTVHGDGSVTGANGCAPITGRSFATPNAILLTRAPIAVSPTCPLSEDLTVGLSWLSVDGDTLRLPNGRAMIAGSPPTDLIMRPNTTWQITRLNEQALDPDGTHGITILNDGRTAQLDNGCSMQRAVVGTGPGLWSLTPNGRDASGMNPFRAFACPSPYGDAPPDTTKDTVSALYRYAVSKAWAVTSADDNTIAFNFDDPIGAPQTLVLSAVPGVEIHHLFGRKLAMVEATGPDGDLPLTGEEALLSLTQDFIGGHDGCNGGGGSYRVQGDRLLVSDYAQTLMECPGPGAHISAVHRRATSGQSVVTVGADWIRFTDKTGYTLFHARE